jgi:signal transduction histidine kinase
MDARVDFLANFRYTRSILSFTTRRGEIVKKFLRTTRDFFVAYPAVLSGYIIYLYFFLTTMKYYQDFKEKSLGLSDIFQSFDALAWMWLLALALVKVIQYREKSHEEARRRESSERELAQHRSQLETMQQVTRALQHQINNPLTIVLAYTTKAQRKVKGDAELEKYLTEVRTATDRIIQALKDYSSSGTYRTVETPVGKMAVPGGSA